MKDFINNLLLALGGRKFILANISMACGMYIEIHTQRGVSPAFAGLVVAILGAFSVTNTLNTKSYLDSKPNNQSGRVDALEGKVEMLTATAAAAAQAAANTQTMVENAIKAAGGKK